MASEGQTLYIFETIYSLSLLVEHALHKQVITTDLPPREILDWKFKQLGLHDDKKCSESFVPNFKILLRRYYVLTQGSPDTMKEMENNVLKMFSTKKLVKSWITLFYFVFYAKSRTCLLYTSPSPRDS